MSTAQYALNLGLLLYILATNLGTRPVTKRRMLLPVVLVAVAAGFFLRDVPTSGNDGTLELLGIAVGAVLGVVAGLLVRVRQGADGRLHTEAGAPYAFLWVIVIGGRVLFAYGADHWFSRDIAAFSVEHQITGAGAWTAAFVLMALTMVLARVAVTATLAARSVRLDRTAVAA
ncbi:hypothetical protein GCM10023258_23180 [Terrabacter aeriphilus]|uniref:Integral membrane protein n=1 Tax=Terrabacter aeriphilus TaxID=515662 RepID=A0ABP9JCR8_9MICO